jgi:hypothetical protein
MRRVLEDLFTKHKGHDLMVKAAKNMLAKGGRDALGVMELTAKLFDHMDQQAGVTTGIVLVSNINPMKLREAPVPLADFAREVSRRLGTSRASAYRAIHRAADAGAIRLMEL